MNKKIQKVREDIRKAEARLKEDEEYLKTLRARQRQLEDDEIIAQIRSMQAKGGDIMDTLRKVQEMKAGYAPATTNEREDLEHDTPTSELVLKLSEEINGSASCSPVKDEEIPYSVPLTWVWCRLSNIGTTNIGLTYHPEDTSATGTIVARSCNIVNGKMDYSDLVRVTCSIRDNQYLGTNDILICARNGSKALVGKCAIFEGEPSTVAFGAFMAVFRTPLYRYVYYYFNTTVFKRNFSGDDSKQINQVTQKILKESLIPIPPLEEQQRIVDKIDQAFSVLDTIDMMQAQYADNLTVLKSKLIDAAIQGKLTEQMPEDGTAEELFQQIQAEKQELIKAGKIKKQKPLSEIKDEEIPFEIPDNWKWARIGDVFTLQSGKNMPASEIKDSSDDDHLIPCYGGNGERGFVKEANVEGYHAIIGRQGALCGNINFAQGPFYATEHAVVVYEYAGTNMNWAGITLRALNLNQYATSVAQPGLAVNKIDKVLIPLPPLAEQKRIVAKLDELLQLSYV